MMTCQGWVSSNQVTLWMGLVNCPPLESLTCQCHQTEAPGGSEPDWRISQVQSTFTSLPGVKVGKALASTVPQVSWLLPYSNTTDSMLPEAWNSALKSI